MPPKTPVTTPISTLTIKGWPSRSLVAQLPTAKKASPTASAQRRMRRCQKRCTRRTMTGAKMVSPSVIQIHCGCESQ